MLYIMNLIKPLFINMIDIGGFCKYLNLSDLL